MPTAFWREQPLPTKIQRLGPAARPARAEKLRSSSSRQQRRCVSCVRLLMTTIIGSYCVAIRGSIQPVDKLRLCWDCRNRSRRCRKPSAVPAIHSGGSQACALLECSHTRLRGNCDKHIGGLRVMGQVGGVQLFCGDLSGGRHGLPLLLFIQAPKSRTVLRGVHGRLCIDRAPCTKTVRVP